MRSEAAVERLNLHLKGKSDEADHLRLLNVQLRDMVEMSRKEAALQEENRVAEESRLRNKISRMEEFIFKQDQQKLGDYLKLADEKFDTRTAEASKQREPGQEVLRRLD